MWPSWPLCPLRSSFSVASVLLWCLDCFVAYGVKSRSKPSRAEQGGVFHLCTEGRCSAWMFDVRVCSDRVHTVMNPSSSCGYSGWVILEWKQRWITITHTNNHSHTGRQQLWFWHIIMRSDTFAVNLVEFFILELMCELIISQFGSTTYYYYSNLILK